MSAADVLLTSARALQRSGLAWPPGPYEALRMIREVSRGGTNPVTLVAIAAARWPHRAAVIDDDGTITYGELQSRMEALAHHLHRSGVKPGEAVGVLCRNGRAFLEALFATVSQGADVILLNTEFRGDALRSALRTHEVETVVCDHEFAERLHDVDKGIAVIDPAAIDRHDRAARPKIAGSGRIVLLTSGTTGAPKGVPRRPDIASALGIGASIIDRTRLHSGSRIAVAVPLFHGLGLGMAMLTVALGGTILTRRSFDAEAALAQASLHRADAFTAVPIMLARILELPDDVRRRNPIPSLRVVLSSGARLDPSLAARFMDAYGDILYNGYGSTEVGIAALATPADLRAAPETVGRPAAGCPVRILDEQDRTVAPTVVGRVFVGGELNFEGYTGGGGKTVVANMTSTGDMGYFDEEGRLFIVAREDDMIVSGGENVYPRAVENALADHPDVVDNAVIGVPDEQFGQRLAAYIVPRASTGVDVEAIRKYLKDKVSRFEQPRDVSVVEKIPRNPAGKVLANELSE